MQLHQTAAEFITEPRCRLAQGLDMFCTSPRREAIQRPRFSQGDADDPMLLEDSIPEDLVSGLQAKGHKVGRSQIIGSVQALMIGPDGKFYGAADTRRPDAGVVSVVAY